MSVYIKGMEMPKNCWDCPFCMDFDFLDPYKCAACMHDFEDGIDMYEHSHPDWCPLIPVPDHGRLIDADALEEKTDDRYSLGEIGRRERDDIVDALRYCAPTIIPADKEVEE